MKCIKGYEVQPLKSGAGWYLGTLDEEGLPNCRISTRYAKTKEEAEELPADRQTNCIENEWCNGGCGCFGQQVLYNISDILSDIDDTLNS